MVFGDLDGATIDLVSVRRDSGGFCVNHMSLRWQQAWDPQHFCLGLALAETGMVKMLIYNQGGKWWWKGHQPERKGREPSARVREPRCCMEGWMHGKPERAVWWRPWRNVDGRWDVMGGMGIQIHSTLSKTLGARQDLAFRIFQFLDRLWSTCIM